MITSVGGGVHARWDNYGELGQSRYVCFTYFFISKGRREKYSGENI